MAKLTDDEIGDLADRLKAVLLDMPGDHAPEQLRVAFGLVLAITQSQPDAGLMAFAAAASCIARGKVDPEGSVEVHVCQPGRVTVYEGTGQISRFDIEDGDYGPKLSRPVKH